MGSPSEAQPLITAMNRDPHPWVRREAITALAMTASRSSAVELRAEQGGNVGECARPKPDEAPKIVGRQVAAAAIAAVLKDEPDADVRVTAIEALKGIGLVTAVDSLTAVISDDADPKVRT